MSLEAARHATEGALARSGDNIIIAYRIVADASMSGVSRHRDVCRQELEYLHGTRAAGRRRHFAKRFTRAS